MNVNPAPLNPEEAALIEPDTKVLLCGLMQGRNFGDVVISDCVKYLIKKSAKKDGLNNVKISTLDIRRQKDKKSLNRVRNSDMVMFPGGGFIKYKQENLPRDMIRVVSRAEKYGIPVAFNAVGMEGYDESDEGCQSLFGMLHNRCTRYITSRDYAEDINNTYLKDGYLSAKRVADPAVWAADTYKIKRDENSQVVGLGVAREGLFLDYGLPLTKEDLLSVWSEIIRNLENDGVKYKLFTNGLRQDEEFLTDLLVYMGKEELREEISLPSAENARELVQYIAGFSSIIACRMHANIIAFSLGVPSVAFVWNDKLRFFGESIGCKERYLEYTQLKDTKLVLDTLKKAQLEGYGEGVLKREKASAYKSVREFFSPFAKELLKNRRQDLYRKKLVCFGLPNLESPKLNDDFFTENVNYFVTEDKPLKGATCLGRPVYHVKKLRKLRKPFVIVSETVEYPDAAKVLEKYKYLEKTDFTNMHSYTRYVYKKGEVFLAEPKTI